MRIKKEGKIMAERRSGRDRSDGRNDYYGAGNTRGYGGNGAGGYYGNPQGDYGDAAGYYGNPQGGYMNDGQAGYYGNPQGGYVDDGQSGYYGNPQGYYGGPQDGYGNGTPGGAGRNNRGKKKKKKRRKIIFIIEIIVLLILALGLFAMVQLNRMDRVKLSDILVNSGIVKSGYRNIALFGVDSREGQLESGTNSDTIMVASINQKTGDVKLVSVYRDTYLDNTNGEYRKATECYAGGGAERSINMLNKNLDLDITDFVTVDFNAIIKVVDALGGVDIEITEEERGWLNGYLVETSQVTGVDYTTVDSAGLQHLTGIQAMAYCRIRYTEGWDFKRTERQRTVLNKIFEAAQSQGVASLANLVNTMLPYISTSLSNTELLSLAASISRYEIVDSIGFPFEQQPADLASAGDCVVPVNLAANVSELHERLFGTAGYTPSQTVQEISNKIISDTGIQ